MDKIIHDIYYKAAIAYNEKHLCFWPLDGNHHLWFRWMCVFKLPLDLKTAQQPKPSHG